jgi:hypothetical protein
VKAGTFCTAMKMWQSDVFESLFGLGFPENPYNHLVHPLISESCSDNGQWTMDNGQLKMES